MARVSPIKNKSALVDPGADWKLQDYVTALSKAFDVPAADATLRAVKQAYSTFSSRASYVPGPEIVSKRADEQLKALQTKMDALAAAKKAADAEVKKQAGAVKTLKSA